MEKPPSDRGVKQNCWCTYDSCCRLCAAAASVLPIKMSSVPYWQRHSMRSPVLVHLVASCRVWMLEQKKKITTHIKQSWNNGVACKLERKKGKNKREWSQSKSQCRLVLLKLQSWRQKKKEDPWRSSEGLHWLFIHLFVCVEKLASNLKGENHFNIWRAHIGSQDSGLLTTVGYHEWTHERSCAAHWSLLTFTRLKANDTKMQNVWTRNVRIKVFTPVAMWIEKKFW